MYAQIILRHGNFQLAEEHIGHLWIKMLARMDQYFADAVGDKCLRHGGGFDKLRARTDYGNYFQNLNS